MPSILDSILGAVQAKFTGYASVASDILLPWMQQFMVRATPIVEREARSGAKCEIPAIVPPGVRQPCGNGALIRCAVCRRASCLGHVFVNVAAEAVCFECVGVAARARGQTFRHDQQQQQAPPPQQKPSPRREEIEAALKTLGLEKTASWEEVETAYKSLLRKHHPDRKRTEDGKAKATERFKRVRTAYDALKSMHERKAA